MAVSNVPFPEFFFFFLTCPGEPAMLFSTWLLIFEKYLLVIDATRDAWLDERWRVVLLPCFRYRGTMVFQLIA